MKRIILLSLFTQLLWQYAACQPHISIKDISWLKNSTKHKSLLKDDDSVFKSTQINSKWENESAIVLCQRTLLSFKKETVPCNDSFCFNSKKKEQKILIEERTRRKILLKAESALKQYRVLYFKRVYETDVFAARITKKNGSVQTIELSDSQKVEDIRVVPKIFKNQTDNKPSLFHTSPFYKLEVNNLEEGDIIEYESAVTQPYSLLKDNSDFALFYYTCEAGMPIQKQILEIETDSKYSIVCKSVKDAPTFTQISKAGQKIYRWEDNAREKIADAEYVNALTETPAIKFLISCAKDKKNILRPPDIGTGPHFSIDAMKEKAQALWFTSKKQNKDIAAKADHIYNSLKKKGITNNTDEEYARKAYYAIRAETFYNNWSDYTFAKTFACLIEKKKLSYEVIVTNSSKQTGINDISFRQELSWIIRFGKNYFCNPNEHGNPNELFQRYAGNAVIRFDGRDTKAPANIDSLPQGDEHTNILLTQIRVTPDMNGKTKTYIDKTVEAKGCTKEQLIDDVLAGTSFMETDFKTYDGNGMWEELDDKKKSEAIIIFNKQKLLWKEIKAKVMSASAENDYGFEVTNYNNFRIMQDGRNYKKPVLKYGETFTITGLIDTEGEDVIIKLPSMIGVQQQSDVTGHLRTLPVDIGYPATMKWQIGFPIPDGYRAIGLDSLNEYLENELGSFESTARINGDNTLMLEIIQTFKVKQTEASNWPQVQQILNAAYKFSQLKITLNKKIVEPGSEKSIIKN